MSRIDALRQLRSDREYIASNNVLDILNAFIAALVQERPCGQANVLSFMHKWSHPLYKAPYPSPPKRDTDRRDVYTSLSTYLDVSELKVINEKADEAPSAPTVRDILLSVSSPPADEHSTCPYPLVGGIGRNYFVRKDGLLSASPDISCCQSQRLSPSKPKVPPTVDCPRCAAQQRTEAETQTTSERERVPSGHPSVALKKRSSWVGVQDSPLPTPSFQTGDKGKAPAPSEPPAGGKTVTDDAGEAPVPHNAATESCNKEESYEGDQEYSQMGNDNEEENYEECDDNNNIDDPDSITREELMHLFPSPDGLYRYVYIDDEQSNEITGDPKTQICEGSIYSPADKRCVSGEGNYGIVYKGIKLTNASFDAFRDGDANLLSHLRGHSPEAIRAANACQLVDVDFVALKVAKVQKRWSLDEVISLIHCTEKVRQYRLLDSDRYPADAATPEGGALGPAERKLLEGSKHIITLRGPCCYEGRTHSLLIPLPWLPCTLDGWIQWRMAARDQSDATYLSPTCVARTKLFSEEEICHVFRQLLLAVHFLSTECRVAHLDIKPANILLRCGDFGDLDKQIGQDKQAGQPYRGPELVICDGGLMQPFGQPLQQLGDFCYMAPEVYWCDALIGSGSDKNERSRINGKIKENLANEVHVFSGVHDVWSLGCVIIEMMDGYPPFSWEAKDAFEALRDNYISPAPRNAALWSPGLSSALSLCFERDPQLRYTAAAMLDLPLFNGD